jgi:hypothetical protein
LAVETGRDRLQIRPIATISNASEHRFRGAKPMLRLVVIALFVVVIWVLLLKLLDRKRPLDWNGIAFAIGFIALAFYLRHVTGIG